MTANAITKLLAARHVEDVFIPECRTSAAAGSRTMDAWAMLKSWANPRSFGYEIKVARSDFIRDDKWRNYLPCCTDFYFVCPHGLIKPDELPADAGLMYVGKTGAASLRIVKKAPQRDTKIPENFYRGLLMSRCTIGLDRSSSTYWQQWLAKREEDREIGHQVSKSLRNRYATEVVRVENEQRWIKANAEKVLRLEEAFKKAGVNVRCYDPDMESARIAAEIARVIPPHLVHLFSNAASALTEVHRELVRLRAATTQENPCQQKSA